MKRTLAILFALFATAAFAQPWPSKPIKIIVPYPAGGTSDILARALSPGLQAALGQAIVVENKPGATGNVGADFVAKSPPDGYTLLLADIGSLAISPSVFTGLPFEPVKDFAPVIMVAYSPHLLVVHPSVPAKDARELVALAKAKPDTFNFAVSGIGGANHLAGIDFAQRAGIKWTYVPYKGGSQALTDMVGGQSNVMFNGMLATYPFVKDGKLKVLAVSSAKRFSAAPEIPTVAESGMKGFEFASWYGLWAPKGLPADLVTKIQGEVAKIVERPDVKERLGVLGFEPIGSTPDYFAKYIKGEMAKYEQIVKDANIKAE